MSAQKKRFPILYLTHICLQTIHHLKCFLHKAHNFNMPFSAYKSFESYRVQTIQIFYNPEVEQEMKKKKQKL